MDLAILYLDSSNIEKWGVIILVPGWSGDEVVLEAKDQIRRFNERREERNLWRHNELSSRY